MLSFFKSWKEDLPAGLVVFLVAVPLCLGIALASEAPPFAGIIAGIVGGIIVGMISGSAIGVSGPAAGLTAIVATAIHDLGTGGFELFLAAVVIAGIIQVLLGVLRAGFVTHFFPNTVIKGMLAGIGVIIILKQLPHAVGYDKDPEGDESFSQIDGETTFSEIWRSLDHFTTPSAIVITLASLALLILWERKFIQKTFLRYVPGALLVVAGGIVTTTLLQGTSWELVSDHRVNMGIDGKSVGELVTFPDFTGFGRLDIYVIAVTLALVASLESLLCTDAADRLDPLQRVTPTNRELVAQGSGNIVSGLLGGLPVTQVVVRTTANVQAGGRTKLAAIIHGVLIAIAVLTIANLLNLVPYASLAAILFLVGYKLTKPAILKEVYREGWLSFIPFIATLVFVVRFDLLSGVAIGMLISGTITLIQWLTISELKKNRIVLHYREERSYHLELPDFLSFLRKSAVLKALDKIPDNSAVHIDLSNVRVISPDIRESIAEFHRKAALKNIQVHISQPSEVD